MVLSFLLLPILTSSSKEPTPQFHQSSPFLALAQVRKALRNTGFLGNFPGRGLRSQPEIPYFV